MTHANRDRVSNAAALAIVAALCACAVIPACIETPNGLRLNTAAANLVNAAFDDACPEESMIPYVGAELVLTCPGQEKAVAAALAAETIVDAGAPTVTKRAIVIAGKRVGMRLPRAIDAGGAG